MIPAGRSLLKSPEDLAWLRETQPATRAHAFVAAIIIGNEDSPRRIVLCERDHYRTAAWILDRDDESEPQGYRVRRVEDLHEAAP